MDATRHCNALPDRLPLGRNGTLEIAAAALQTRADAEYLEPLFFIAVGCQGPVRLSLVEEAARVVDVTAQQLEVGQCLACIGHRGGVRVCSTLREVAVQQCRASLSIFQGVIEVR